MNPLRIEQVTWTSGHEAIYAIRHAVFVIEQSVPESLEIDEHDPSAVHVLAWLDDRPVGTGRLLPTGRIGRLAVQRARRGQGIGRALLDDLVRIARSQGMRPIHLAAQLPALPFYRAAGFVARGRVFLDAGIEHRMMVLDETLIER